MKGTPGRGAFPLRNWPSMPSSFRFFLKTTSSRMKLAMSGVTLLKETR